MLNFNISSIYWWIVRHVAHKEENSKSVIVILLLCNLLLFVCGLWILIKWNTVPMLHF